MFHKNQHYPIKRHTGFTIVELLIVIVVIGILAAIVIVAFNGVQQRANTAAVKSDLVNIHKKLELFKVDSASGGYPTNTTELGSLNISITKSAYFTPSDRNQFYYCLGPTGQTYGVGAITKDNKGFLMSAGNVREAGTSASVYGSNTCTEAGHPSSAGSALSGWTPSGWANWVKG